MHTCAYALAASARSVRGHCAVTVRSLCGHCVVSVRSLCGHCAVIVRPMRPRRTPCVTTACAQILDASKLAVEGPAAHLELSTVPYSLSKARLRQSLARVSPATMLCCRTMPYCRTIVCCRTMVCCRTALYCRAYDAILPYDAVLPYDGVLP